jgi:hypothetical protein
MVVGLGMVVATMSFAPTGQAQDLWVTFFMVGPGSDSCGRVLEAVEAEHKTRPPNPKPGAVYTLEYASYEGYASGFLTGVNWAKAMANDNADALVGSSTHDHFAGAMVWLENYCRQHPLDNYFQALVSLRKTLAATERQ